MSSLVWQAGLLKHAELDNILAGSGCTRGTRCEIQSARIQRAEY